MIEKARPYASTLAYVLLCLLMLRGLLFAHGTPAFRHDWVWPLTTSGLHEYFLDVFQPLAPSNWNEAAWLPRITPVGLVLFCASFAIPASALFLKCMLFATLLAGACGAESFARAMGAKSPGAFLAGAVFIANPFMADQYIAGHIWTLVGASLLPWALTAVLRDAHWALQTLLFASLSIDVHQVIYGALGVICVYARYRSRRQIAGAVLGLCAFIVPLVGVVSANAGGALAGQRVYALYTAVNSARLWDAVRGIGYFAGYDRMLLSPLSSVALWVFPACAAASLIVFRRYSAAALFGAGAVLSAGVYGPLGSVVSHAVNGASPLSMFRELFNFTQITWLGASLGVAFVGETWGIVGAIGAVAILAFYPQISSGFTRLVPDYAPSASAQSALDALETATGSDVVLPLPLTIPMRPYAVTTSGLDPIGLSIGTHGVLSAMHGAPAAARAYLTAYLGNRDVARRLRIGALVSRAWIDEAVNALEPGYHAPRENVQVGTPTADRWTVQFFGQGDLVTLGPGQVCAPGDFRRLLTPETLVFAGDNKECGALPLPTDSLFAPYPQAGWVQYDPVWRLEPRAASTLGGSIFTEGVRPFPRFQGCIATHLYRYEGYFSGRPFSRSVRGCGAPTATGPTVISSVVDSTRASTQTVPSYAQITNAHDYGFGVVLRGVLRGAALLQLRRTYLSGWFGISRGALVFGRHLKSDGQFNGWEVRGNGTFACVLIYLPALLIYLLEAALLVQWALAIVIMLLDHTRNFDKKEVVR